jgi:hypothetical protein
MVILLLVYAEQLHPLLVEQDVPHRAYHKRRNSRHDEGQKVISKHKLAFLFLIDLVDIFGLRSFAPFEREQRQAHRSVCATLL